jgi:hypothetical protein
MYLCDDNYSGLSDPKMRCRMEQLDEGPSWESTPSYDIRTKAAFFRRASRCEKDAEKRLYHESPLHFW